MKPEKSISSHKTIDVFAMDRVHKLCVYSGKKLWTFHIMYEDAWVYRYRRLLKFVYYITSSFLICWKPKLELSCRGEERVLGANFISWRFRKARDRAEYSKVKLRENKQNKLGRNYQRYEEMELAKNGHENLAKL